MSELMNCTEGRENRRWRLLTTVSAASLLVAALAPAAASDDSDRPTLWIEVGGQLESISKAQDRFEPRFVVDPVPLEARPWGPIPSIYGYGTLIDPGFPNPFEPVSPLAAQSPPPNAIGGEGKLSFQPKGSDWTFSASVRYGRATGHKMVERAIPMVKGSIGTSNQRIHFLGYFPNDKYAESLALFDDSRASYTESHMVLDFQAGRDVGLGLFGRHATSTVNFGVRFAQFISKSAVRVDAIPNILAYKHDQYPPYTKYSLRFQSYLMRGQTARSFHGIGPALSWSNSAPLLGNPDNIDLAVDFGINGAVLFGRQKASVSHHTSHHDRLMFHKAQGYDQNKLVYNTYVSPPARAKSVAVPNIGAFAGLSINFPRAKVSLGYRADFFFGAMDAGVDERHTADMNFHGPFAKLSIGLGG